MQVSQSGATTTVKADGRVFKITYSNRYRRFQIKEHNRLFAEGYSFQNALDQIEYRLTN